MVGNISTTQQNEYKSIRYLNLFRVLISFFFFSIIFKKFGNIVGVAYTLDIAKFIASTYLATAILIWIASALFRKKSRIIGLVALVIDLPMLISLTLLFDGLNKGWLIIPVISIGSFAMLSRKPYTILIMPIIATALLWIVPKFISIVDNETDFTSILLYSITYFAIALVGIRQSQTYTQTLLLTQKQKTKITNLSKVSELVIDKMQSGVIAFDNEYKIILINNSATNITRISRGQRLPKEIIKKIIASTKSLQNSFTIYGEDILITLANKEKESGLNLLFIESQREINEKSQQINLATLGQLSATIAHELRNPMASIYSASQLLQESEEINDEEKVLTDIIVKQVERSNKIIEDILLMSKPHIAEQVNINLYDKLLKFKDDFYIKHKSEKNALEINFPNKNLTIKFDTSHLSQLFWNLSENAIKHSQEKQLQITISNQEQFILIDFKNNGNSLDPIVEESLFTPFFTTHTQGTGLGLYICREMCKSNNAKLEYLRQDMQHVFRIHIKK